MFVLGAGIVALLAGQMSKTAHAATAAAPAYDTNGNLLPLTNYREWVYLSTGIDMSYKAKSDGIERQSMFDNIFVNPEAYRSFQQTGKWPDKTVLILEAREAKNRGSINLQGQCQG
jgi:type II secretory pathway component GspD/PulD (secretin)